MKLCLSFFILFYSLSGSLAESQDLISDLVPADTEISLYEMSPTIAGQLLAFYFNMAINLVANLHVNYASMVVSTYCKAAMTLGVKPAKTPDIKTMNLELRTSCAVESIPLLEAEKLLNSKLFDKRKQKLVILVLGWKTTTNNSDTFDNYAKAFSCRGDTNFVALDASKAITTLYYWSAYNTGEVGRYLALALQKLTKVVPIQNIHLIGHSLGAHIVGAAGSHFQQLTGKKLPHITGLDPAKPCFNHGTALMRITRDDADFVDILHSNPGVLGQDEDVGHVDYYAGGWMSVRVGCLTFSCSHSMALDYYLESIFPNNEGNFIGTHCYFKFMLMTHMCFGTKLRLSIDTQPHLTTKGIYLLDVNANEPYGRNASDKFVPVSEQKCGRCDG